MLFLIILFTLFSQSALGWYDNYWNYRKEITIDHTKVSVALTDFPVLVDITDSDLQSKAQTDGDDILFTDSSDTKLSHEIELYESGTGHLVAWVNVPSVSSSADTVIYIYYGNSLASNQEDVTNTWDSNYVMVQHLEETSGTHYDSTANDNDGTPGGGDPLKIPNMNAAGIADGADDFDGVNDCVAVAHDNSLNLGTGDFTISAWIKFTNCIDTDIIRKGNTQTAPEANYKMEVLSNKVSGCLQGSNPGGGGTITTSESYNDNEWHNAVFSRESGVSYLYVDTELKGSDSSAGIDLTNTAGMSIGSKDGCADDHFAGIIDEVRVSNISRDFDWINTSYLSMNDDFITYGLEEVKDDNAPNVILNYPADGETLNSVLVDLNVTLTDSDSPLLNASFNLRNCSEGAEKFTIVMLPDTQKYLIGGAYSDRVTNQTKWIVANKDALNIQFVLHLGDIVENYNNVESEWQDANTSMSVLDEGGVPYLVLPGNHDYTNSNDNFSFYDNYFNYSRYIGYDWYKGHYPSNSNRNNYALMEIEGMKFGFIALRWNAPDADLLWANNTVNAHPDYRFIVTTHEYVDGSGRTTMGNNIWNKFAKYHDNIFMIHNGHITSPVESRFASIGENGNTVYEILTNYQSDTNYGGKLRYYTFVPSEDKIYAYTYATYTNTYYTSANSQFTLNLDMDSGEMDYNAVCNNINVVSNTHTICTVNLENSTAYEWSVNVTDGNSSTISDIWNFTVLLLEEYQPPVVTLNSPGNGATLTNTEVLFNCSATDDKNLANITLYGNWTGSWQSHETKGLAGTSDSAAFLVNLDYNSGYLWNCLACDDPNDCSFAASNYSFNVEQAPEPGAWADNNCQYRKKLTFDNSASSANLADFPVLIKLDSSRIDYTKTSATDIRFYDGTTLLYKETELWDELGDSFVWVKVSQVDNTNDDYIYAYYDCSDTNNDDAESVWDSNYVMVQHLEETSGTHYDSTSNDNDGAPGGGDPLKIPDMNAAGIADGADDFDGTDDYIAVAHDTSLNFGTGDFTISAWVKFPAINNDADIMRKGNLEPGTAPEANYKLELVDNKISGRVQGSNPGGTGAVTTVATYNGDNWHNAVFLREAGTLYLYIDGNLEGTQTGAGIDLTNTANMAIGSKDEGNDDFFDGIIDEVRVSNTFRGSDWVNASYLSINDQFVSYGTEEEKTTECETDADTNEDGKISMSELMTYIGRWKLGEVSMPDLMKAIGFWKAGIGC